MVHSLDFDRFAGQDLTGADGCIETHGVALQGLHVASRHSSRSRTQWQLQLWNSMDWFVGENLPETIDFPIKYRGFL